MAKTTRLQLNIGFDRFSKNSVWLNEKDENYQILDEAIGTVFNSARNNGIEIKESENHIDWDNEQ